MIRKNIRFISVAIGALFITGLSPVFASNVKTVTFGNGLWLEQGIQHNKSNTQTAVVFQDGLTFSLSASLSSANIGNKNGSALSIKNATLWKSQDGAFTFSLQVSNEGTTSRLESLAFNNVQVHRLNQGGKSVRVSESASSNNRSLRGSQTIKASDLYDAGPDSLTPLSKETIGSWDLTVKNTGSELAGIKSLSFDFTVGGDPWITLAAKPKVYEDSTAIVTVTSSNSIKGLEVDDFKVANGTVKSLKENADNYTLEIIPASTVGESIMVSLPAGATTPANQSSNTIEIEIIDNTPSVTLSHPLRSGDYLDPEHKPRYVTTVNDDDPAMVYVTFSRPVKGLTTSDFTIKNGTITDLKGKNDTYELTVTPTGKAGDLIELSLPANCVNPINRGDHNQELNKASNILPTNIVDPTLFLDKAFTYHGANSTTDEVEVIKDIEYGRGHTKGGSVKTKLLLDIYRPIDDPKNPILPDKLPLYIAVFGGGFVKGSKEVGHTTGYCQGLVQRGYVAASINYRLSNPETKPPNESDLGPTKHGKSNIAVRDLAKAIRWLRQNADKYKIDTDRIIIGGNSAGGFAVLLYGNSNPGSLDTAKYIEKDGETRLVQGDFKFREWEVDDFRTPVRLDVAALHPQHGGVVTGSDNITQPTILVHGSKDGVVNPEKSRSVSRSFESRKPKPHVHTFLEAPGEGHASFNYWDYVSHEKNGKNYEEHWVEFFFEHLNLAELLTESPQSMESTTKRAGDDLTTSIKYDDRIQYQLTKSSDRKTWLPVAGTPTKNNGILEMKVPATIPETFYRWELTFDHKEITHKDYLILTLGEIDDDGVFHSPNPALLKVKVKSQLSGELDFDIKCTLKTDSAKDAKTIDSFEQMLTVASQSEKWTEASLNPKAPGFYRFSCVLEYGGAEVVERSMVIGYDPEKMITPLTRQDDFDEFWKKRKQELAAVEPQFKMTKDSERSTADFNVYLVEMYSYGNILVRGWYSEPTSPGPHPAIMNVPGYGSTMYPMMGRKGVATFALNPRGHGNSRDDISPTRSEYLITGLDPKAPEKYIYVGAYMDCVRAIDFLASRSEIDPKRIGVEGTSQGGGLSLATAALDNRIALCMTDIPFLCNWGGYAETTGRLDQADSQERFRIMSYVDAMNLAPWITCPVVMSIGLQDDKVPPRTSYAAFNTIKSEKACHVYPTGGHSVGTAHRRLKDSWVKEKFQID